MPRYTRQPVRVSVIVSDPEGRELEVYADFFDTDSMTITEVQAVDEGADVEWAENRPDEVAEAIILEAIDRDAAMQEDEADRRYERSRDETAYDRERDA